MRLKKQTTAKAIIAALTSGLFVLFLGLVRSEPRIAAEAQVPAPVPTPDYQRFFAPGRDAGSVQPQTTPATPVAPQQTTRTHTRSRAS